MANVGGKGSIDFVGGEAFNMPFQTSVGYWGTQGIAPTTITRSTDGKIGFYFPAGSMVSGEFSLFLVVQTDAMNFDTGLVDTGVGKDLTGWQPAPAPTPEPGTLMLLGTGLLGLAGAVKAKLSA